MPLSLLLLGIAFYTLGRLHERLDERWPSVAGFGGIFIGLGLLLGLGTAFVFTFAGFWENVREGFPCLMRDTVHHYQCVERSYSGFDPTVEVLVLLGLAAAMAGISALVRGLRSPAVRAESALLLAFLVLVGVAAARPWFPLAVPFNLLFFAAALGCIWRGYMQADNKFIYGGLAAVAIGLFARYCETSWGLLSRSGFFFLGGVLLLLLAAAMETARRRMLARPSGG